VKLTEQKQKERVNAYGLDLDAILTVRVVEARDLMPMDLNGKSDPYVVLKLGSMQTQRTNYVNSELNPVWNEVFTFDVDTGKELLELSVFDKDDFGSDDFLGAFALKLDGYRDQQPHDEWFELQPDKSTAQWHGRLRLVIQYVYSKTRVLTGYIGMWTEQIEAEEAEVRDLKAVLLQMEAPFGFIQGFTSEVARRAQDDLDETRQLPDQDASVPPELAKRLEEMEVHEHAIEHHVDVYASKLAVKAGLDTVPWFQLTWWLLWIYTCLTLFGMFLRPDFLNLTVCVVGIYMMFNLDIITKTKFRLLVLGIFLSQIYDALWLYLKHSEYAAASDGESGLRHLSLSLSYASFILRVSPSQVNRCLADCDGCLLEGLPGLRENHPGASRAANRAQLYNP